MNPLLGPVGFSSELETPVYVEFERLNDKPGNYVSFSIAKHVRVLSLHTDSRQQFWLAFYDGLIEGQEQNKPEDEPVSTEFPTEEQGLRWFAQKLTDFTKDCPVK